MLVMNPADGEVLAMVGSADYNTAAIRGQINLTGTDPLGWRCVGSSFKVYTYAAALQAGLVSPTSLLNDQTGTIGGHTFSVWDVLSLWLITQCPACSHRSKLLGL